ncbi:hypothetical protein JOB18_027244 [Solea senegalensis]|uniref:Uncharacterized protein n=1 Tax=Solea senegalensis TaxID=28829 RepID=A0AAV6PI21_SOLSE|nr:hypothetical protein JOB18_027244 [Solea senegalensis]
MDDDEELERAMLSTEELVECTAAPSSSSLSAEVRPSPATQTAIFWPCCVFRPCSGHVQLILCLHAGVPTNKKGS